MRDNQARDIEVSGWEASGWTLRRGLRLAAITLGIGLVMASGAARAQDDEDDDKTFEEKIIDGIMAGIGGTNMENRGIEYRERSPLVVPPRLDLRPPENARGEIKDANWPKDPDEARRKAAIANRKKNNKDPVEASRILTPPNWRRQDRGPENRRRPAPARYQQQQPDPQPVAARLQRRLQRPVRRQQDRTAPFKGEPTRESLTQPPAGYQTPSPNFAYGTGPKESLNKEYDPAAGKYGE